ncbi:putative krueppel c2h2-type zinc finger protein [Danaus plexippus plexippus]|uniref:Krueppel c2h2-type zinc finger protein n=1 Tax=Danaus plexippus plexippus TaxID=278856 RepID=A0A212F826_DANPL|nr:putative krueppel c2h2-type zinc finger protein [Danaus plexippus plexippus]
MCECKCRLCLKVSSNIVEELWEGCKILEQLFTCLGHHVVINKDLPNKICNNCVMKIEDIYKYQQFIRQNEIKLQQELNNIIIHSEIVNINEVKIEDQILDEEKSIDQEKNVKIKSEITEENVKNITELHGEVIQKNDVELYPVKQEIENKIVYSNEDKDINKEISNAIKLDETKRFSCLTCFEVFPNQLELLRHYQNVELEKYNKNNTDVESKPVKYNVFTDDNGLYYKCERCYKKYRQKSYINRHVLSHIERRPFLCKLCGKTYQTASIIVSHGKIHTGDIYACTYNCGYRSVHKHVVKNHEKRHKGEFKYKCQTCGKGFQVRSWYQQHQNIHDGVKPFKCDICGMSFHLHRYLTTHRSNVHPQSSVRKPWVCKQCEYPCDSKNSLNLHLKDKHGLVIKKSNLCDVCGKVLKDSQQLKVHKRAVHLNIKPYVCGTCNKSFPKKYTLKNHEQTHKGKTFLCSMCDKMFAKDASLQKHVQRCHITSKYRCHECDKSFSSKMTLTVHVKNCNRK